MELPSCPSCNQSVLDDDATHCPFCGASMSGDGSSVPVTETPIATKPSAEEPPEGQLGTTAASQPEVVPDAITPGDPQQEDLESDPFAVDPLVSHRAIPAATESTKKRTWQVHCPMCDTPGFVPRQAAGHEVRCANPQCLVPIFTAPAAPSDPSAEPPPAEEPTDSSGKGPLVALLLILLAGGAGGAWWFLTPPSPAPRNPAPTAADQNPPLGRVNNVPDNATDTTKVHPDTSGSVTPKAVDSVAEVSPEIIRDQAPTLMIAAAQERDRNRSKPFCRRLTAEHFAEIGQQEAALAELKQLQQIGPDLPHLHVNALIELWWHQQSSGSASPGPQLTEAIQKSANLLSSDPFAVDVAVTLGCALIASGQVPLAESTTARLWSPTLPARLRLDQLRCRQSRTYHLANRHTSPPSLRDDASVDSLIIVRLVARGHSDAALAWARQGSEPFGRVGRLAAWATATRNSNQSATATKQVVAKEAPAIRAVVHARLALVAAATHNQAAAAESVAQATQALRQCAQSRTLSLGNLKQLLRLPIDDVSGWWLKAQAQAELIGALNLIGQTEDARKLFPDALATARSLGPAREDVSNRLKAIQSMGSAALIQHMKTELELTGNDEARQAGQRYIRKCQDWLQLAGQRAACLDRLHRWAILHGLGQASWKDIRDHGLTNDVSARDPFTSSKLPSFLYLTFRASGNTSATTEMNNALSAGLPVDVTEILRQKTRDALDNGDLDTVVKAITADGSTRRDRNSRFARRRVLFELVGVAANSKTPIQALQLVNSLRDPRLAIWREDAYRLVAAQLATNGQHTIAWSFATHADRAPTERIALLAGLLEGIRVKETRSSSPGP